MEVLFIGNDHLIKLTGLQNSETLAYINNATVGADILDPDTEASILSGAISMAYVAASDGNYTGIIEEDVPLIDGTFYLVEVTAMASPDDVAFWRFKRHAEYRQP